MLALHLFGLAVHFFVLNKWYKHHPNTIETRLYLVLKKCLASRSIQTKSGAIHMNMEPSSRNWAGAMAFLHLELFLELLLV